MPPVRASRPLTIGIPSAGIPTSPALAAGQLAADAFVTGVAPNTSPLSIPEPVPVTRVIAFASIYLPVVVSTTGAPPPGTAVLQIAMIAGDLRWQQQQTLSLLPDPTGTYATAQATYAADFVNPPVLEGGRQISFAYSVAFDKSMAPSAYDIVLSATFQPGATPPIITPAQGTITATSLDARNYWNS